MSDITNGIMCDTICGMAMTLRLSGDEAAALRETAALENRSVHETVRAAVREYTDRVNRQALLAAVLEVEVPRFADAFRRLGE